MSRVGFGLNGIKGIVDSSFYPNYSNMETSLGKAFTLTADTLYAWPILVDETININTIVLRVKTGSGSINCRGGIITAGADRKPGSLLIDGGVIDVTSSGNRTATIATTELTAGLYYLAFVADGALICSENDLCNEGLQSTLCLPHTSLTLPVIGYTASHTYAALPANYPTATDVTGIDRFSCAIQNI